MRSDRMERSCEGPRLKLWKTGGLAVADLRGTEALFDEEELNVLGQQLYGLVDDGEVVLINLRDVQHLSSGVLARLAVLHGRLKRAQGRLLICGICPSLRDVLRQCRLDQVFEISSGDAEAVAANWAQGTAIDTPQSSPLA